MTTWMCITPERVEKTQRIMDALAAGWPGGKVCVGEPPSFDAQRDEFITWGQIWIAETLIRRARKSGARFFQIDNAYWNAARGGPIGYYRFMYCRPNPIWIADVGLRDERAKQIGEIPTFPLWRKGDEVVIAMPGPDMGRAFDLGVPEWCDAVLERVKKCTDRPIRVRSRFAQHPLAQDLANAHCVVTHSSNVGVDAILAGVPVFVEPTSMCVWAGSTDLRKIESPHYPSKEHLTDWWWSLMCQQFTIVEMQSGVAYHYLDYVRHNAVIGAWAHRDPPSP